MVACKKWPATQRWENLLPAGPVDAWDVRLPPKNLEGAWPQAKDELSSTSSNKENRVEPWQTAPARCGQSDRSM